MTFGGHFGKPSVGNSCLVPRLLLMTYHYFGGLLWGAFCRGQLLSLPLITFHYFWGVLWEAFHPGQLLSNWATFDDFSLLRGVTLESLPSGTAA